MSCAARKEADHRCGMLSLSLVHIFIRFELGLYLHCGPSTQSWSFVWFPIGSSRYQLGCTVTAVSAHTGGTSKKYYTKYRDFVEAPLCTGWPISSRTWVGLTWIWDVPQAVGLYCSSGAAQARQWNIPNPSQPNPTQSARRWVTLYVRWWNIPNLCQPNPSPRMEHLVVFCLFTKNTLKFWY